MSLNLPPLYDRKELFSVGRMVELEKRIGKIEAAREIPDLTVFAAGSYARLEASEHSDIDLFFVCKGNRSEETLRRTNELRLFGNLIKLADEMDFPRFSGDCRYLEVHAADEALSALGSPQDDAQNFFTLRMLMLLESRPVFGSDVYDETVASFVSSYYRDYPDHQHTFEPRFMVNDVLRFWRTLLANYEHRRNQKGTEEERVAQKIRNYKLKYSRLTTCFSMVAALASLDSPVEEDQVLKIVRKTPRERLVDLAGIAEPVQGTVESLLGDYAVFLEHTERSKDDLESIFSDKGERARLFDQANDFGDRFYELLVAVDQASGRQVLRSLVI